MDTETTWAGSHRALMGRLAGAAGLLFVAVGSVSMGGKFFDSLSISQIVSWVRSAPEAISVEGLSVGVGAVLVAFLMLYLLWSTGRRGPLAVMATVSLAAFVAVDWVAAGIYFGLAEAGKYDGADAGIVVLFALTKMTTFTDGFVVGIAFLVVNALALRSRVLAAPLAWLGIFVGVWHVLDMPVQLALTHSIDGITGPIGAGTALLWFLATSAMLLIRPVSSSARGAVPVAAA